MKKLLAAMFVALLMAGCGEEARKEAVQEEAKDDPSVPLAIPCVACGEKVSKKTKECRQCGHPTPDSVVAYKEAQELVRIRADEERRLILLNAVDEDDMGDNYTGWVKERAQSGGVGADSAQGGGYDDVFSQYKDGKQDGACRIWHENGQKRTWDQYKDGKKDGLQTRWYENGQKATESNYKEGEPHGLRTMWHENGQKRWRIYSVGYRFSIYGDSWKPNGEKCPETNLKDGNGVLVLYDDDGTEYSRSTYKDGKRVRD